MATQAGDLVVLGGEAREGCGSEVGVLGDRLISGGDAFLEGGGLGFQPGDLGVSEVGQVIGCAQGFQPCFEFFSQVGVGARTVERGAIDACLGNARDRAVVALRASPGIA